MEDKIKISFLDCPPCGSKGVKNNKTCHECSGKGLGVFWMNKFLYWGKRINKQTIRKDKIAEVLNLLVYAALIIIGIAGILFQVYRIYEFGYNSIFRIAFWNEFEIYNLIFWTSLITDLFLYYRLEKASSLRVKISKKKYEQDIETTEIVSWERASKLSHDQSIDISKSFNEESMERIKKAWELSKKYRHSRVMPIHLLGSLLSSPKISYIFFRLELDIKAFAHRIAKAINRIPQGTGNIYLSKELKEILIIAYINSYIKKLEWVDEAQLFLEIIESDKWIQEVFFDMEAEMDKIRNVVEWIRINDLLRQRWQKFRQRARLKPKGVMNRAMTAVATPILDSCSYDMTQMAINGYLEPCVGREKELDEIFRIFEGGRSSVIMVGEPGIGKQSIAEGIAQLMVEEDVPEILQDKRLVSLSIPHLISGLSPAKAQEKLLIIINEIIRAGNIILFINDVQEIMGITAGEEGSLDLSEVLSQAISERKFLCISTATKINHSKYIENSTLGKNLKKINIEEPKGNEAIRILESKVGVIEYKNNIYFSYNALAKVVEFSDKYLHDQYLPEKAIGLLEETGIYVKNNKGKGSVVLLEDIAKIISEKVKIPLTKLTEKESEKLLNLEDEMHKRMINQEEAVKTVASALRRARAELRSKDRPIANFLFLGPTGVGKTELAKTVADIMFGSADQMIRLDMSEYQEKESIEMLIGKPGTKEGGYLTEAVRKNPYSLLLLDELEKAHKDILNVFLQVFDDGRLTDVLGRTIDFTNIIIIATSNAGSYYIQDEVMKNTPIEEIKNGLINKELRAFFTPEFLNRFDGVIVFKPLTLENVVKIANLMLKQVQKRLKEKGISFYAAPEAIQELAKTGYDPKFGARPLRRAIQDKVDNIIAEYLLGHKIARRDTIVLEAGNKIIIKKAEEL